MFWLTSEPFIVGKLRQYIGTICGRRACRPGVLAGWLSAWFLAVSGLPALAQVSLFDLIGGAEGGVVEVPAEGSTGRVDIDYLLEIAGSSDADPVMIAPSDDAIVVAFAGADLTLSNVVLRQEGATQFALYVDGGTVTLRDCRIEGAFDTAIYIASGTVRVENCEITGAAYGIAAQPGSALDLKQTLISDASEVAIYVDGAALSASGLSVRNGGANAVYLQGAATARFADLTLTGQSDIMLALVGGPSVSAVGVSIAGGGGTGVLAQDAGAVSLHDITISDAATGIIAQGGGPIELDGFRIDATQTGVQINAVRTPGSVLRDGAITMQPGGYGLVVIDSPGTRAEYVRASGGEVGFMVQGDLAGSVVSDSAATGQSLYAALAQNVSDPGGAPAAMVTGSSLIAVGEALGFAAFDVAALALVDNRIAAQGPVAVYSDRSWISRFEDNVIVTAPAEIDREVVLTNLENGARRFLVDGSTAPLAGTTPPVGLNRQISFTDLIEQPGFDLGIRTDIADFAETGTGQAGLLVALAEPATEVSAGSDTATLSLAPLPEGWRWGARAFEVSLSPVSGPTLVVQPGDFPLSLPKGLYELRMGGQPIDVLDISADRDLAVAPPPAPFMVWRDDEGVVHRGASLQLRADNALAVLLAGFRPLRIGEWVGYGHYAHARAGFDPELARLAVAEARAALPEVLAAYLAASGPDDGAGRNRAWQLQRMHFALLAAFDDAALSDWIFDTFADDSLTPEAISAATRFEMRQGTVSDGRLRREALARFRAAPDADLTRSIVDAYARTGDQAGLALLAELHRHAVAQAGPSEVVNYGLSTLILAPTDEVLGLYRDYLVRLREAGNLYLSGAEVPWESQGSPQVWRDAGLAIGMLATYGRPEDRALFDIPVPIPAGVEALLPYTRDPVRLTASLFGADGPVDEWRRYGWTYRHGTLLCDSLTLRTREDRAVIRAGIRTQMRNMIINDIVEDFWAKGADERSGMLRSIEFAFDLSGSHCLLNGRVVETGGNAADEERNKFENNDYDPAWWVRPIRAQRAMESFGKGEAFVVLDGLAHFSWDELRGWMGQGSPDPQLLRAFELYHRLLNDGFVNDFDYFAHGSEQRVFRLRSDGGSGSISIAGHVNVRPLRDGDDLLIAVQHTILSPDFGGLAAMITAPDREPYERDNRRRMFEVVTLDRAGEAVAVVYERTTPEGVHLFRAAGVSGLDGLTMHVGMRFVDTTWSLDFSLYDSSLAIRERRDATVFEVPS